MRVADLNWMQLEAYLQRDDRIVLPLGSTEQHAYLSLATDSILAERIAVEAAEPLGVPVLPALAYGLTPYFAAFPGSPSVRPETYLSFVGELLESLRGQGFKRFLLLNGHGGNAPVEALIGDKVVVHDWWKAPKTFAVVKAIDPDASHASWTENFPWTRLPGVVLPAGKKPPTPRVSEDPMAVRAALGDGSFGGYWERSDEELMRVWRTGVEETREVLADLG
ncbi:MAG TPA: creatininase family protein [Candidatus Dormibacteraeota bacterium]|nr:creatininase family protein [Candidatus Dormibacteraeota bacterium]